MNLRNTQAAHCPWDTQLDIVVLLMRMDTLGRAFYGYVTSKQCIASLFNHDRLIDVIIFDNIWSSNGMRTLITVSTVVKLSLMMIGWSPRIARRYSLAFTHDTEGFTPPLA